MPTTKEFKLEELSKYFHLPEKAVAKELGICLTSLKKLCRSYGITRWPFRKLKSIQRSLAKAQDETASPTSTSPQIIGKLNDKSGTEAASSALHGMHDDGGVQGDAVRINRGRRAYQLGGKTFHLNEEEKNIVKLTLGKPGTTTGVLPAELRPLPLSHPDSRDPAEMRGARAAAAAAAAAAARGAVVDVTKSDILSAPLSTGSFSCQASGATLEVRHWTNLWTAEHLQKRLLEPLGGNRLSVSPDLILAVLHFDSDRTAARAELICRAAAAAAENNLRSQAAAAAAAVAQQGAVSALHGSISSAGEPMKLEIPSRLSSGLGGSSSCVVSGGSCPESSSALSPVFKSVATPPTSYTSYLFEHPSHFDSHGVTLSGGGGSGSAGGASGVGMSGAGGANGAGVGTGASSSMQFQLDQEGSCLDVAHSIGQHEDLGGDVLLHGSEALFYRGGESPKMETTRPPVSAHDAVGGSAVADEVGSSGAAGNARMGVGALRLDTAGLPPSTLGSDRGLTLSAGGGAGASPTQPFLRSPSLSFATAVPPLSPTLGPVATSASALLATSPPLSPAAHTTTTAQTAMDSTPAQSHVSDGMVASQASHVATEVAESCDSTGPSSQPCSGGALAGLWAEVGSGGSVGMGSLRLQTAGLPPSTLCSDSGLTLSGGFLAQSLFSNVNTPQPPASAAIAGNQSLSLFLPGGASSHLAHDGGTESAGQGGNHVPATKNAEVVSGDGVAGEIAASASAVAAAAAVARGVEARDGGGGGGGGGGGEAGGEEGACGGDMPSMGDVDLAC